MESFPRFEGLHRACAPGRPIRNSYANRRAFMTSGERQLCCATASSMGAQIDDAGMGIAQFRDRDKIAARPEQMRTVAALFHESGKFGQMGIVPSPFHHD